VATVKEPFTSKYRGNINSEVVEISFKPGEEVQILREWKNESCLIRKGNQVFNVAKKYLNA
jgi:hypothetical protein